MPETRPARRLPRGRTVVLVGLCLALVSGIGTWLLLGRKSPEPCNGLLDNDQVMTSLGITPAERPPSCADLAKAITKATTGDRPGLHTQAQAQAMKDILYAFTWPYGEELSLDPELRSPLASALADYSADVYARLHSLNPDYSVKSGAATPPWQGSEGFHISVDYRHLLSVLRAVSKDPADHATIRAAVTRYAAQDLASVPDGATGDDFTVPSARSGRALGALDGVALSTIQPFDDKQVKQWQARVVDGLLAVPIEEPAFKENPTGHITGAWLQGLSTAAPDARADYLRAQPVSIARIWAEARNTAEAPKQSLLAAVETSANAARHEAERALRQ